MADLVKLYLQAKYPQGSEEFLEQKAALLEDALASYSKRSGKKCMKCQQFRSLNEFGTDSSKFDGLSVYCRRCRR